MPQSFCRRITDRGNRSENTATSSPSHYARSCLMSGDGALKIWAAAVASANMHYQAYRAGHPLGCDRWGAALDVLHGLSRILNEALPVSESAAGVRITSEYRNLSQAFYHASVKR